MYDNGEKMGNRALEGKKVAVLVENEFIAEEIDKYETFFESQGAQVDFMTYMMGHKERRIYSDITNPNDSKKPAWQRQDDYGNIIKSEEQRAKNIYIEIADANPNDYAIVITAANYVACRLREIPPVGCLGNKSMVRSPAAVRFMASAMMNPYIVKGALCHALWILTPVPELLSGRKVICHTVVLADVLNAGAIYIPDEKHVVVDNDLVTGRSAKDLDEFTEELLATYIKIKNKQIQY